VENNEGDSQVEELFHNWQLLRINMYISSEEFKEKNKHKYASKAAMNRALRNHLNRKYKADSQKLFGMQREAWGLF